MLFEMALSISRECTGSYRGGNALLVGVGGSGKQSLTRLATYCAGYDIFSIQLMRGYGETEFREDLKTLYKLLGTKEVVFLFTDAHVALEGFLEFLNNMLTTGMVPALYEQDEMDGGVAASFDLSRDSCPSDEVVAAFIFEFGAVRREPFPVDAMLRARSAPRELRAQRMQGGRHRRHLCEFVEVLRQQVPEQPASRTGDVAVGRQVTIAMPIVPGIDQQLRDRLVLRLAGVGAEIKYDSWPSHDDDVLRTGRPTRYPKLPSSSSLKLISQMRTARTSCNI